MRRRVGRYHGNVTSRFLLGIPKLHSFQSLPLTTVSISTRGIFICSKHKNVILLFHPLQPSLHSVFSLKIRLNTVMYCTVLYYNDLLMLATRQFLAVMSSSIFELLLSMQLKGQSQPAFSVGHDIIFSSVVQTIRNKLVCFIQCKANVRSLIFRDQRHQGWIVTKRGPGFLQRIGLVAHPAVRWVRLIQSMGQTHNNKYIIK